MSPSGINDFCAKPLIGSLADISSLNRAQPEVTITQVESTPNDPSRADVTVEVKETTYLGKKSGAQEVRLFRDGRLVGFKEGLFFLVTTIALNSGSMGFSFRPVGRNRSLSALMHSTTIA